MYLSKSPYRNLKVHEKQDVSYQVLVSVNVFKKKEAGSYRLGNVGCKAFATGGLNQLLWFSNLTLTQTVYFIRTNNYKLS